MTDKLEISEHVRCTDADRDACLTRLEDALRRGAISAEVHEARVHVALRETDKSALAALARDLPPLLYVPPTRWPYLRRALAWGLFAASLSAIPIVLLWFGAQGGGFANQPPAGPVAESVCGVFAVMGWAIGAGIILWCKVGDAVHGYRRASR